MMDFDTKRVVHEIKLFFNHVIDECNITNYEDIICRRSFANFYSINMFCKCGYTTTIDLSDMTYSNNKFSVSDLIDNLPLIFDGYKNQREEQVYLQMEFNF